MFQNHKTLSSYLMRNKNDLDHEVEDFYNLLGELEEDETEISPEEELPAPLEAEPQEENAEDDFLSREEYDGELSVDVWETKDFIMIRSAIPGVTVSDLDISVAHDMVTIRGRRSEPLIPEGADYFFQECYWGNFSRSIILPVEVNSRKVAAKLENGILTITLPKIKKDKRINISVRGE